jgi:hypothetical protein
MEKSYRGSCHCGDVAFECTVDLADTSRCNCSICGKSRFWKAIAKRDAFRLLRGQSALGEYMFGSKNIHHMFCKRCGVKPFGRGAHPDLGEFYAVNVMCLDGVSDRELVAAATEVIYQDGRNDAQDRAPAEARYL